MRDNDLYTVAIMSGELPVITWYGQIDNLIGPRNAKTSNRGLSGVLAYRRLNSINFALEAGVSLPAI